MPSHYTITAAWFDTCYPDYVTDWSGIVAGVAREGQTRDELIEAVVDEVYSTDEFPAGDYVYEILKAAIGACVPAEQRKLWPVDGMGNEITDEDADVPEEQPSAWFRVRLEVSPLRIALGQADSAGFVLATCTDRGAALNDQTIDGEQWEAPRDLLEAYALLTDRPTLDAELRAEGYDVDATHYAAPAGLK